MSLRRRLCPWSVNFVGCSLKDRRARTTGIWAHTCVPWSGMMVKRTTSCSKRIQHTLPKDERDAVNSMFVSIFQVHAADELTGESPGIL